MDTEKNKYTCYICGKELSGSNVSDEHIILNAIGGKLHSFNLLCNSCNNRLGEKSDAALAEDLSFFTDMLEVSKDRDNGHKLIMKDREGTEFVVFKGSRNVSLRHPSIKTEKDGERIIASSLQDVKKIIEGKFKRNELTAVQKNEIISKAKIEEVRPVLTKIICISENAFPSIVKSAVNYFVEKTHDDSAVRHIIPYIQGDKKCDDILHLILFDKLPFEENDGEVTHMIHIEGDESTGMLYALMEYFSSYTYIVVLDKNYHGKHINMTYTYDVIGNKEVTRNFSLQVNNLWLENYKKKFSSNSNYFLNEFKLRIDRVMKIWDDKVLKMAFYDIFQKVLDRHKSEDVLTKEMINEISRDIVSFLEKRFIEHDKLLKTP